MAEGQNRADVSIRVVTKDIGFLPPEERPRGVSVYAGPTGPIVSIALIAENALSGRELDEGLFREDDLLLAG